MTRWEKFLCAIGLHQWCTCWSLYSHYRECNLCGRRVNV